MQSSPVVAACRNLFQIHPFLARGIMPMLRVEDIKITLAKRLHFSSRKCDNHRDQPETVVYLENYNTLTEYILENNLEVILALESHSDSSAPNTAYAFPGNHGHNSPFSHHRSVIAKNKHYFTGSLPAKKLRLSSFLYYKGLISRYQVLESIAWQKDRRPLLGQMAMQIGKLTADDFARIIVHVKNGECFGQVARRLKLLSIEVIKTLVKAQEKYDCRIGRYFTRKKILSENDIALLNAEKIKHNDRFSN